MNELLEAALKYQEMGLSVIPIKPKNKTPIIKWEEHQNRIAGSEEIKQWWRKTPNANIGIVTGKTSGIFVVDLDKYDPEYSEDIFLQYFSDSLITPAVNTARGGQHIYFKYPDDSKITIGARSLPGIDHRGEGGYVVAPPSIGENGKPYTWSETRFERGALLPPPAAYINNISTNTIRDVVNSVVSSEKNTTNNYKHYKILQKGTRDDELFYCANQLIKGGRGEEFARQVLEILAKNANPPFPEKEIDIKIASALARVERKERNLSAEIREWITLQEGYFNTTDILQTLQLTTREEKKNLTVILTRLNHEGIIEKYGERRGQYRTVQKLEENIIDLTSADTTCLNIKFPLGIHDLVKIMPKNIIIIAGESNAGKTAFLLNTAAKNMLDHPVFYFSSEMGGAELKERLQNYQEYVPFDLWKHCTFIERANDFDVAIRPDAINIIDFLEIHDEFYKIGGYIKKIFDKLNKGIAIIAIQKNKGRDDGLGGARSIEKARLYLSMAPGTIKIVKAKNWVSSMVNPNGLQLDYKLAKGMVFKADSNWAKSDV